MVTAIDPTNPLHVEAISWEPRNGVTVEYSSMNGGLTWQSQDLPGAYDGPSIAFDPQGDLFVALEEPPVLGQQDSHAVQILDRRPADPFSSLQSSSWTFDAGVDKPSITIGVDPVHGQQALYLTLQEQGVLTGWDITNAGSGLTLSPYGTNPGGTMRILSSQYNSWGCPVVAPSGDIYVTTPGGYTARLNGGLWSASPTWTQFQWPSPDPANAFDGASTLSFDRVPADPLRGIFNGPELGFSPQGVLYMTYVQIDPGVQRGNLYNTPYTHVYVVSCANPESSTPIWGAPVAVDTDTNVTELLPALAVDPLTGVIGVQYYTTAGTSDPTFETANVQFACSTGGGAAGTWSAKIITTRLPSNMVQHDANYNDGSLDYGEFVGLDMRGGVAQALFANASATQVDAYTCRIAISDSAFPATVVADAPAVYWRLNDTTGTTAADASGNGNTGEYTAGALLNQSGLVSHDDFARSIEGTVTSNFVYNPTSVSVEVQMMLSAISSSGIIAGFANGSGSGVTYYDKDLYVDTSGRVCWSVNDGNPVTIAGPVLNHSEEYHLVGTFDAQQQMAHLYVNGVDVGDAPASSTLTGYIANDVMVGGETAAFQNPLDFRAGEFAVYDYALSPARVLAHYYTGLAPYAGYVMADAPAAYWRLDEQSGTTAIDSSGNGIEGTYTGSYTQGATGALQGAVDSAALFNGGMITGGGLGTNSLDNKTHGPVTVECWVNSDWTGSNLVFAKGSNGNWAYGIQIVDGQIYILENAAGYASGAFIPTNQWSYVALVYNSGGPTDVYVNGILEAAPNYETTSDSSGDWLIGAGASPQLIDEVAVYKYPLSASEIRQHYLAGCPTYKQTVLYDSPTVYWRLDDPSGSTTAYDDSNTNTTGL